MEMKRKKIIWVFGWIMCLVFAAGMAKNVWAFSGAEIDKNVDATLERLYSEVTDSRELVQDAKGALVFPSVYKAGFGIGGEYGEGALRINGDTVDYYNTVAGSFGFQIGAQKKSIILLFMQDDVLNKFRASSNWKVGADASVAIINVGTDGSLDTARFNKPIIAFVIGQKGLMYNLTLEGAKMTKMDPSENK